ncbi:hypothetical protein E8E13_011032 [Curvularia kusanoi]|uniref:Uncharacterized protein n=1 Tax=Curvularia kusanoi TaxID=90978 RepID=A0A9P4WBP9_CURKU|nr:hypothetical protein E8E13_011032 [Curvularia kusanoi]
MIKEKTYQFALTADECALFRRLRELESKYEAEYPLIYDGTESVLRKPMSLTFESEGRQIARFDVNGSQLLKECASISMQIVLNLLTPKEDHADPKDASTEDEASRNLRSEEVRKDVTTALSNTPRSVVPEGPVIWKELFPPCVQEVSVFVAPQDLNTEVQDDLRARFPGVSIVATLDSLSEVLDSIRISEAKDEYEEAMMLVEDYEKKAKIPSTETGTVHGAPSSSKKRSNQSTVERARKKKPKRW